MAKLLYFALLFGVFHNLVFIQAFVAAYQEYNWNKVTVKVNDTVDYIITEKKYTYVKIKIQSVLKKLYFQFWLGPEGLSNTKLKLRVHTCTKAVHSSCYWPSICMYYPKHR